MFHPNTGKKKFVLLFVLSLAAVFYLATGKRAAAEIKNISDGNESNESKESISISAKVNNEKVEIGQPFSLVITIEGDLSGAKLEKINFPAQIQVISQSQSTSISVQLGRIQRSINFEYLLVAREPGEVLIGPFKISKKGKTYQTEELKLSIKKPILPPSLDSGERYTL
jgi:hypothetical protein